MSEAWNQLLYWLSAQGDGSQKNLSQTCQTLGLAAKPDQIRRDLQLLGHLEVQPGAERWSITRPCWIQTAHKDAWFWTGARVPHTLEQERAQADLEITSQQGAPDRISRRTEPADHVGCTSERLLGYLPDLAFWRAHLVQVDLHYPLAEYQFERWDVERQAFQALPGIPPISPDPYIADYEGTGVYRLKKRVIRRPMDHYTKILYWDGSIGKKHWLIADFIGLRFAHFYDNPTDEELRFIYRESSAELWIPEHQRWPYIYERCLVLASGYLAEKTSLAGYDYPLLKFRGIPRDYVEHFEHLSDTLKIEAI